MSKHTNSKKQPGYSYRQVPSGNWQFRVANGSAKPATKTFKNFDSDERWAQRPHIGKKLRGFLAFLVSYNFTKSVI